MKKYEAFVQSKKNVTITDSFVYHVQPIFSNHKPFITMVIPSTQGKATDREVEMLQILKNKLEGSIFKIIGFAFDGNTTYNKLHVDFFSNYYI